MQTINASSIEQGIPQIVAAVVAAAKAAGFNITAASVEGDIREGLKAAEPYMKNETAIPFVISIPDGVKAAVKTETVREAAAPASNRHQGHPAPVRTTNAKWNDRCGRWQDSVTGGFIPFV